MDRTKVLLADDHILFRKGLASIMADREDIEVVGEASNGIEAVHKARELKPDLILMDIRMPGCNGLEATRTIREEMPSTRIVMLTVSDDDEDLFEAIKCGAQGYLLKSVKPEHLFDMLKGVFRGESPISPSIASKIIQEFTKQKGKQEPFSPTAALTPREKNILQMLAQGASNKEIATQLCITEGTVKNHLHSILGKLHLENRVQAAAFALRTGIVPKSNSKDEGSSSD